jgi:hypothetical protein
MMRSGVRFSGVRGIVFAILQSLTLQVRVLPERGEALREVVQ